MSLDLMLKPLDVVMLIIPVFACLTIALLEVEMDIGCILPGLILGCKGLFLK
jgi:hypothetical protein